jgi:hypothetical protein
MVARAEMHLAVAVINDGMHTSSCWNAQQFDPVFELFIAGRAS